jgi:hypothetical protein
MQYHFPYSFLTPHQRFSSSHGHYNPKEKTTSYCNVNSKELHHKQEQRKNKSTTIEEGDDIAAVTFAATKPQKKGKFAIFLQQREKGGDSCRLLLQYKVAAFCAMLQGKKKQNKTKEKEGDGNYRRLVCEVALQRSFKRGRRRR